MTPLEAQSYLAEKLPERIVTEHLTRPAQTNLDGTKHESYSEYKFRWLDKGNWPVRPEIPEESWQQIALWVEEKMTRPQRLVYSDRLDSICDNNNKTDWYPFEAIHATYITRATAMKESGL